MNCLQELNFKIEDNFLFYLRNSELQNFLRQKIDLLNLIESLISSSMRNKIPSVMMILTHLGYDKNNHLNHQIIFELSVILELITISSILQEESQNNKGADLKKFSKLSRISTSELLTTAGLLSTIASNKILKLELKKNTIEKILNSFNNARLNYFQGLIAQKLLVKKIPGIRNTTVLDLYANQEEQIFTMPMRIGAIIADCNDIEIKKIDHCSSLFAKVFRILADINRFSANHALDYNIVSAFLWKNTDSNEKKELRKLYDSIQIQCDNEKIETIMNKIEKYDILPKLKEYAYDLKDTGISALFNTEMKDNVKDEIADYIESLLLRNSPKS